MRRAGVAALAALALAPAHATASTGWRVAELPGVGPDVELDRHGRGLVAWSYTDPARTVPGSERPDPAYRRIELGEVDVRSRRVRRVASLRAPGAQAWVLAVNARGDAVVAWQWIDPHCDDIYRCDDGVRVSVRRAGGRFSRPRTVVSGRVSFRLHAGLDERGHGLLLWDGRYGAGRGIGIARLRPGARRFERARLLTARAAFFDAATSPDGETVVAWLRRPARDPDHEPRVLEVVSLRAGRASRPRALTPPGGSRGPAIAIAPGGAVQLAWVDLGPRRADGGGYAGPEEIRTALRARPGTPFRAAGSLPASNGGFDVAVGPGGRAAVAHGDPPDRAPPGEPYGIGPWAMEVALRGRGQPFGSFGRLSEDGVGVPVVALDRRGRALATWSQHRSRSLLVAEAPLGGAFGPATTLAAPAGHVGPPDLEVTPSGTAALAWHESGGGGDPVRGRLALRR